MNEQRDRQLIAVTELNQLDNASAIPTLKTKIECSNAAF